MLASKLFIYSTVFRVKRKDIQGHNQQPVLQIRQEKMFTIYYSFNHNTDIHQPKSLQLSEDNHMIDGIACGIKTRGVLAKFFFSLHFKIEQKKIS